ncbi:AAA family ATPase [Mycobacterium sp. URHB0021]
MLDVPAEPKFTLTRLADVQPERVSWLWPGWLPMGKLVTLDGDPGLGKSTLSDEFSAVVTSGGRWPDGTTCDHQGAVLLMSAEDGLADTVRPRLDAAGADVNQVFAIEGVPVDDEGTLRPPTLGDVQLLERAITEYSARLLVVDVIMAYLPTGTDAHKDQDIRRVLNRLSSLADRTGCTVLLLRHLNKAKGADPLYRGGGSIGIVGAARGGLLVASDPDDPERRVLASVKSNLGTTPNSLAYRLVGAGDHGVARVQWEGHTDHTALSLLAEPHDDRGATTEAEQWLHDYLTEQGAASSKAAKADAAKAGIRERTLQRAVKSLGVVIESRGFPRLTWWQLPSRANCATVTPVSQNLGATGATGDDLHKQDGATEPNTQSRQLRETGATAPGGLTASTPGQTDRVLHAVSNARGDLNLQKAEISVCVCGEALLPDNETALCAECAFVARQDAVASAQARLNGST